ncbi:MAG: c-type cytochrome [Betaproteobacteria bacterium]|nr:MAG: c-type cytochrome [Betaproteobacteria bacterium]
MTSDVYIEQNCPPIQTVCQMQIPGGTRELIDVDWDQFEFWLRGLGVPARRNVNDDQFVRGERFFAKAQCAVCHVPEMTTAKAFPEFPELANQTIRAYTDLLLHDMGEALADGRPDFRAGPRDWRTPPLWALGLSQTVNGSTALLHDGRARNVTEAILWHGGEARRSRDAFVNMPEEDRAALVRFIESI